MENDGTNNRRNFSAGKAVKKSIFRQLCLKRNPFPQYVIDGIRFLELLDAVWFRYTTYKRETGKI